MHGDSPSVHFATKPMHGDSPSVHFATKPVHSFSTVGCATKTLLQMKQHQCAMNGVALRMSVQCKSAERVIEAWRRCNRGTAYPCAVGAHRHRLAAHSYGQLEAKGRWAVPPHAVPACARVDTHGVLARDEVLRDVIHAVDGASRRDQRGGISWISHGWNTRIERGSVGGVWHG